MRKSDLIQFYCLGFSIVFIFIVMVSGAYAQLDLKNLSQDTINATLYERQNSIIARIDKYDTYLTAIIIGTASNLIAHLIDLKRRTELRRK